MAQPATNPKIEELRFKLKTDPKSRLFYQLAEELRRAGQFAESEKILRSGLEIYPAYLAAWVSLGRVLRELKDDAGAVDPLNKALQLDPGNVVAARLLADAYLAIGEKVEAIKKYKLVHALLPSDETLEVQIAKLEQELYAEPPAEPQAEAQAEPEPQNVFESQPEPQLDLQSEPEPAPLVLDTPIVEDVPQFFAPPIEESPFDKTNPPFDEAAELLGEPAQFERAQVEEETRDAEPMAFAHEESPFEVPSQSYGETAFEVEAPAGLHIVELPVAEDMLEPLPEETASFYEPPPAAVDLVEPTAFAAEEDLPAGDLPSAGASSLTPYEETPLGQSPSGEADVAETSAGESGGPGWFEMPAADVDAVPDPFDAEPAPPSPRGDAADTSTMADLYARQGLIDDARHIYENILARDPGNRDVRAKLDALTPPDSPPLANPLGDSPGGNPPADQPPTRNPTIAKLKQWLFKVSGREVGRV